MTLIFLALITAPALSQHPIPEAERWATITHAGNAAYVIPPDAPPGGVQYPHDPGRVDYEYQISRTEVTGAEWFEFVQAYAPYVSDADEATTAFHSNQIRAIETSPGVYTYELRPTRADRAVDIGWRFAARYCNWLHNGKAPQQAAFESGVYESSTFGGDPLTGYTDQRERSPGATYFIPTIDEWVKAAYYDPDRYGEGVPGYWTYPNSTDLQLVSGPPGVGQTSASTAFSLDVASYPDQQSPWGLFDLSGGWSELLETGAIDSEDLLTYRICKGSHIFSDPFPLDPKDIITRLDVRRPDNGLHVGLRVARIIPSPGAASAPAFLALITLRRRR